MKFCERCKNKPTDTIVIKRRPKTAFVKKSKVSKIGIILVA
jgi:hypothetical protein